MNQSLRSMLSVFVVVVLGSKAASGMDKTSIVERINFSATVSVHNASVVGEIIESNQGISNEEIENRANVYALKLKQDLNSGKQVLPESEIKKIRNEIASWEATAGQKADENKVKSTLYNKSLSLIESMVDSYKSNLYFNHSSSLRRSNVSIVFTSGGFVRNERHLTEFVINGEPFSQRKKERVEIVTDYVTTLNPSKLKTLLPANRTAEIQDGSSGKYERVIYDGMLGYNLPVLGRRGVYSGDDSIRLVEEKENNGEKIVVVVLQTQEGGETCVDVREYLPARNYVLKSSSDYRNGSLVSTTLYSDYIELQSGHWYPKSIKSTQYEGSLPQHILKRLANHEIEFYDRSVLEYPDFRSVKTKELRISSIELMNTVPHEIFDQNIPDGTSVIDFTQQGNDGHALSYTVGLDARMVNKQIEAIDGKSVESQLKVTGDISAQGDKKDQRPTLATDEMTRNNNKIMKALGYILVIIIGVSAAVLLVYRRIGVAHRK